MKVPPGLFCMGILLSATPVAAHEQGRAAPFTLTDAANLEALMSLPTGAYPLNRYARYYWREAGSEERVRGVLVSGPQFPPGLYIVDETNHPKVFDGGCGVLRVIYNPQTSSKPEVVCNGMG